MKIEYPGIITRKLFLDQLMLASINCDELVFEFNTFADIHTVPHAKALAVSSYEKIKLIQSNFNQLLCIFHQGKGFDGFDPNNYDGDLINKLNELPIGLIQDIQNDLSDLYEEVKENQLDIIHIDTIVKLHDLDFFSWQLQCAYIDSNEPWGNI